MEKHIRKKAQEHVTQSHQYLKVVELDNFSDCQVEFLLHLLMIVVSLEKLIIQLRPGIRQIGIRKRKRKNYRGDRDIFGYEDNQYRAQFNLEFVQLVKIMHPNIDVVMN